MVRESALSDRQDIFKECCEYIEIAREKEKGKSRPLTMSEIAAKKE